MSGTEITIEKTRNDLQEKKRENLLGAMYQTLSDPIAIVEEARNRKKALLYTKTFKEGAEKIKTMEKY